MSEHDDARRAFLAGGVGAAAGAAISTDAAAQSVMTINDPAVVREIETEFAGYDRALGANDVAALKQFREVTGDIIAKPIAPAMKPCGGAQKASTRLASRANFGPRPTRFEPPAKAARTSPPRSSSRRT